MSFDVKNELTRRNETSLPLQPPPAFAPRIDPLEEAGPLNERPVWVDRAAYAERPEGGTHPAALDAVPAASPGDDSGFRGIGAPGAPNAGPGAGGRLPQETWSTTPGIGAGSRRTRDVSAEDRPADGAPGAAMTPARARELIDGAMRLSASSSSSDNYVRDNITPEVLAHATPQEKAHMLRCLMDGPTGADDERAMGMILKSVRSPEELDAVMRGAGGAEAVWCELESARGSVIDHFRSMGDPGTQMILAIGDGLPTDSSLSDDFVRDHVDARVLARATPEQKAHMLRCLMDGPTGEGDERAMRRVLESIQTPAELRTVMSAAGGAGRVWSELEGQQDAFMRHLRGQGANGQQMILAMAVGMPTDSSDTRAFIRDHVDAGVLGHASVDDKAALVQRLHTSSSEGDRAAMRRVLLTAHDPAELMTIAERGGGLQNVLGMGASHRQLVTDAYNAHSGDAAYARALSELIVDQRFTELSADTKTAVLSQAGNYPDTRSVHNMQRLVQKDWFRSMSLEDQQRSLATVAFISQHPGDRTIIDHTLDLFLRPNAPYRFDWEESGTAYGSAGTTDFHFNRRFLPAGNGPVDATNDDTLHMVTHTVAHEVNHLVNGDRVAQTADYFLEEYRAFYVGFRAEHGRDPTRAEVLDRVRHLLTANTGAYDSIRQALADPTEGPRIVDFMRQVLGRNDVTQANAATLPAVDPNHTAPVPPGDMDN